MRVNEIFYSVQGEGRWTGRPALFVRLSGCNLRCPFCDTDFDAYTEMPAEEIIGELKRLSASCRFVVLTGGEPTLQVRPDFVEQLHRSGYFVAMETNGAYTDSSSLGVDWVTLSPKGPYTGAALKTFRAHELKMVMDDVVSEDEITAVQTAVDVTCYYLQPCDTGDARRNQTIRQRVFDFIQRHPEWTLSLQIHKILNVR